MPLLVIFFCWDWRSGKRLSFRHMNADSRTAANAELSIQNISHQNGDIPGQKSIDEDGIW